MGLGQAFTFNQDIIGAKLALLGDGDSRVLPQLVGIAVSLRRTPADLRRAGSLAPQGLLRLGRNLGSTSRRCSAAPYDRPRPTAPAVRPLADPQRPPQAARPSAAYLLTPGWRSGSNTAVARTIGASPSITPGPTPSRPTPSTGGFRPAPLCRGLGRIDPARSWLTRGPWLNLQAALLAPELGADRPRSHRRPASSRIQGASSAT